MKKHILAIITLVIAGLVSSCGDFDDLNQDPTRPGGDSVSLVAITPTMQTQTHRNLLANGARLSGIVTQQWIGFDAQQVAFTSYDIGESDISNIWENGLYTGSMRDCNDMITRATAENATHTRAVAKIYMAINLGLATNLWGDVPYSEAFLGEQNLSPAYDSQSDIYNSIQTLLDEAIIDLATNDPLGVQGDLVNADWTATAHALKARFYMQLTKRDVNASTKALSEIALAFTGNSDQPIFNFEATPNGGNPLANFGLQRPNTMIIDPHFDNIMSTDPRRSFLMVPNTDGDQLYFESGNTDLFWAQLDSPSPIITYSELKFLEAEATQRTGGNALPILHAAIRANMEFIGVAEAQITSYLATITTSDLEVIITEKYKSLYGANPIQIWNDYRRTNYPTLVPNPNGMNGNDPSGIIPRRFLYPQSERLSNTNSYNNAITNQGGHLLDVDTWAYAN